MHPALRRVAFGFIMLLGLPGTSVALSNGRVWTPVEILFPADVQRLPYPVLDVDSTGKPFLSASARNSATGLKDAIGFRWADSTWIEAWRVGEATNILARVISDHGPHQLIWNTFTSKPTDPANTGYLTSVAATDYALGALDTVALVSSRTAAYSASALGTKRWVAIGDLKTIAGGQLRTQLRVFSSIQPFSWQEVPVSGTGDHGTAIISLSDSSALVAWAGSDDGLRWGTVTGTEWQPSAEVLGTPLCYVPSFRPDATGGVWLAWATKESYVLVSHFQNGSFAPPETLRCAYSDLVQPDLHFSDNLDLSGDPIGRPSVVWTAFDGRTGVSSTCVCSATSDSWPVAEEVADATDGVPTIARDLNGDIWIAWWPYQQDEGVHWKHSYTSAIPSLLQVTHGPSAATISWELDRPAPGSYWSVLRSTDGQGFVEAARIQAGDGTTMNWTDASGSPQVTYRIRRESVDTRFQMEIGESETAVSGTPSIDIRLSLLGGNPITSDSRLRIQGAELGQAQLVVLDIRGRRVLSLPIQIGSESEVFDIGSLVSPLKSAAGVYFITARDRAERTSTPAKFVLLR